MKNTTGFDGSQYFEVPKPLFGKCNVANDFKKNSIIFVITIVSIVTLAVLSLLCIGGFCKYHRLKGQYYERVNLIKSGTNSSATRNSELGVNQKNNEESAAQR